MVARPLFRFCSTIWTGGGTTGLPGLSSGSDPQHGQPGEQQASSQVLLHNTERKYKIAFIFFFVVVKFDLNAFSYHCPHNPALEGIYSSSSFSVSLVEARKKGVDLCVRVHHSLQYW